MGISLGVTILPFSYVLILCNCFIRCKADKRIKRENADPFCFSICLWILVLLFITEFLSLLHCLDGFHIFACWGVVCVALGVILFIALYHYGDVCQQKDEKCLWRHYIAGFKLINLLSYFPIVTAVCVCVLAGQLAFRTVPYNWDSMAYHLARIPHWLQNRTVSHYASNIERQIFSPVVAEYVMLHVYALSGNSDILINYVQCVSFGFNTFFVYRLAKAIGCSSGLSGIAGLLYATTPIAFAESFSTQVDDCSNVFLLIFVLISMEIYSQQAPLLSASFFVKNSEELFALSVCLGIGYLTKPSICLAMGMFLFPIFISCYRRKDRVSCILFCVTVAGLFTLCLCAPEWVRMYKTYGTLSSPEAGLRQMVGTSNPRFVFVNFLKNLLFNLPNVYMIDLSEKMTTRLLRLAFIMHVPINDSSISEDGREFHFNEVRDFGHDTAINPLVVWTWLVVCAFVLVFALGKKLRQQVWIKNKRTAGFMTSKRYSRDQYHYDTETCDAMKNKMRMWYFMLSSASFLFFLLILRWEIYETRYEIPYLSLLCPAISCALEFMKNRIHQNRCEKKKLYYVEKIGLCAWCVGIIALCLHQTVIMYKFHQNIASEQQKNRMQGYYWWWEEQYDVQTLLCNQIKTRSYHSIGLYCNGGYYEYPLWVQLQKKSSLAPIEIKHIFVSNSTAKYESQLFCPEAILWMGSELPRDQYGEQGILNYNGYKYVLDLSYDHNYMLLKRADLSLNMKGDFNRDERI